MPDPNASTLYGIPEIPAGMVLNKPKGYFGVTIPETTTNLVTNTRYPFGAPGTVVNAAKALSQDISIYGPYVVKITPSSAALSSYTFGVGVNGANQTLNVSTSYTFSFYMKGNGGDLFSAEVVMIENTFGGAETVLGTIADFTATGEIERHSIIFTTPNVFPNIPGTGVNIMIRLTKNTATTKVYYVGGVQLEQKLYPTTYCDGYQDGCYWGAHADGSFSYRKPEAFGGRFYYLSDLGIKVTNVSGGGMPPIQHSSQKRAALGGRFYQRSTPTFRVITLSCYIDAPSIADLQNYKEKIIALLSPDVLLQRSKHLLLFFQAVDNIGKPVGKPIEMPCYYIGGLEGTLQNPYQEKFTLQFSEEAPPSIRELYDSSLVTTTLRSSRAYTTGAIIRRSSNRGYEFVTMGAGNSVFTAAYTNYYGEIDMAIGDGANAGILGWTADTPVFDLGSAQPASFIGTITGNIFALASGQAAKYLGGDWANAPAYIRDYGGNAIGAGGPNAAVRGLVLDKVGNLYGTGDFTTPGNRAGKWDGAAWTALGSGLDAPGYAVCMGLDGKIYFVGTFLNAGGIVVTRSAVWNPVTATWAAMGSGLNNTARCLAVGLDGKIYAAGDFTTAGGGSASRIAYWNGAAWFALGTGLNGTVYSINIDPVTGYLYASGSFTATGDGLILFPCKAAVWTGSTWLPLDLELPGNVDIKCIFPTKGGRLFIGTVPASGTGYTSTTTTINYTGSAGTYPFLVIKGPGTLRQLINNTTGQAIYFNDYILQSLETLTLNLDPKNLSFTSDLNGNITGRILAGSNISSWGLTPGPNLIGIYYSGSLTAASELGLFYRNTHWALDASGSFQ